MPDNGNSLDTVQDMRGTITLFHHSTGYPLTWRHDDSANANMDCFGSCTNDHRSMHTVYAHSHTGYDAECYRPGHPPATE